MSRIVAIVAAHALAVFAVVAIAATASADDAPHKCYAPCTVIFAHGIAEDDFGIDYVGARKFYDNRARLTVTNHDPKGR